MRILPYQLKECRMQVYSMNTWSLLSVSLNLLKMAKQTLKNVYCDIEKVLKGMMNEFLPEK